MRKGYGEYPDGWKEFANQLKEDAGWKCIRCGHPHDPENGYCLTVHHVTMNKAEPFEHWWAFLVLCQKCHLTIQAKVDLNQYWFFDHSSWFIPFAAGFYAHINGLPESREYVMAHLEELLELGKPNGLVKKGAINV